MYEAALATIAVICSVRAFSCCFPWNSTLFCLPECSERAAGKSTALMEEVFVCTVYCWIQRNHYSICDAIVLSAEAIWLPILPLASIIALPISTAPIIIAAAITMLPIKFLFSFITLSLRKILLAALFVKKMQRKTMDKAAFFSLLTTRFTVAVWGKRLVLGRFRI